MTKFCLISVHAIAFASVAAVTSSAKIVTKVPATSITRLAVISNTCPSALAIIIVVVAALDTAV